MFYILIHTSWLQTFLSMPVSLEEKLFQIKTKLNIYAVFRNVAGMIFKVLCIELKSLRR